MTLDRFIHRVKCFFSPTYKRHRRSETQKLVTQLKDSKERIIRKIEGLLRENSQRYGELIADGVLCPEEARRLEKKMMYQHHRLSSIKNGGPKGSVDVGAFLRDIFETSDIISEKHGYTRSNPGKEPS